MCTYVCSSAQLFISRNNDFEIRANEYSLTHSQFQLHSLSPLPPSLSHSVSNPFSIPSPPLSPLLPFLPRLPAFYRTWVGCARGWCGGFAGGVSLCMCVKPVTPICLVCTACFSAGEGVRSCFDRRSKTYFLLFRRTPPPNSISARVSSTSPDTNVSRVIGIFETAVCHCRSLFTRYHPHPPPPLLTWIHRGENPTMQACLYAPTMCLPLIFPSASIFFFPSSLRVLPFRPLINPLLTKGRVRKFVKSTDFEPTDRNDIVSSPLRIAFESVKADNHRKADCCCVFP